MNLLHFNNFICPLLLIAPGNTKHDATAPGWIAMMDVLVIKFSFSNSQIYRSAAQGSKYIFLFLFYQSVSLFWANQAEKNKGTPVAAF